MGIFKDQKITQTVHPISPCLHCGRKQSCCSHKTCKTFKTWFSEAWKDIQNEFMRIKEKKNGRKIQRL